MKRIHLLKKTLRDDIIRALDAGGFYPPGKVETRRGATVRVVARDRDAPAGLRVITETPDRVNEAFGGDVVPLVRELTHVDTIDEALATADLCAVLDAIAPLADDAEWPDGVRAALAHFVGAIEVTGGILRGDGAPVGDPEWPDLGDAYVRACEALGVPVAVSLAPTGRNQRLTMKLTDIQFPAFSGLRCLMMPYIQGDPRSVPAAYAPYAEILSSVYLARGEIGFLTIDESRVSKDTPHRGTRAKHGRALHTEAGRLPETCGWGGGTGWGGRYTVTLDEDVEVLLANNLDDSCAIWDARHEDTTVDGDIGHLAHLYPYEAAVLMKAGEVHRIGILTPHESLPAPRDFDRQFLRIVSAGVHGREEYFTENPLMAGVAFA